MKTFLNHARPLITPLLSSKTEAGLLEEIRRSSEQGADAFCLMLEILPKELRTREKITKFISAMEDKPVYVTCYLRNDCINETDDERAEYLLLALECGADIADIRGDMFCAAPGELTEDNEAVEKQKKLIEKIHSMGKEVLMSSHLLFGDEFRFITKERAVEIAKKHRARGADIAKIVAGADTEEHLLECFETITYLKKKADIPTVFLCGGKYALRHRLGCGLIYEPMVFVKEKHLTDTSSPQMPIETIAEIFKNAGMIKENQNESNNNQ